MKNRPQIDLPFGDNPVLDILHIAYVDFSLGRLTTIEKINKIMSATYSSYSKAYLKKLINIVTNSLWFNKSVSPHNIIHLKERGVEVYLNMVQNYRAEKSALEAKQLMFWTLIVSCAAFVVALVSFFCMK